MAEVPAILSDAAEPVGPLAPVEAPPTPGVKIASASKETESADVRSPILVRYFASAAEAAGRDDESLPAVDTVGELRAVLIAAYGDAMARVLRGGSFLVDGVVSRDDSRSVGQRVDVLPPFAGG